MARTTLFFCCLFVLLAAALEAQVRNDSTSRPMIPAIRTTGDIHIDGKLDEPVWQRAGITSFTQLDPVEGAVATEKTEVWVAYDDAALYIAARLHDSPDSISSQIGRHDDFVDSDWFLVGIDSYHDRRTGFYFAVNPAGSVRDGTLYNDSWSDNTWDGIWSTATTIDDSSWTVEIRIPYSQLRFPVQSSYTWGINFHRTILRKNEEDYYVMVPKKESGYVSRFADLVGIADINPPKKLEVLPYVASSGKYLQHSTGDPFNPGSVYSQGIGADVKLGLGSNLTLNGTINPDFGQVELDPAVVNLTQYETFYNEKRPFFVEGSNFFDFGSGGANNNWGFNWGTPQFFYSRRIGRSPTGSVQHNGFTDIPDKTQIIGAAKITGKVSDDWSLAAMQAVTAREFGKVDSSGVRFSDEVEPLAYYGVVRSLREFDDGVHGLGVLATATVRDLDQPYLVENYNKRAFTAGSDGWITLDKDKVWVLTGWIAGTRMEGAASRMLQLQESPLHYYQRPDVHAVHLDSSATSLSGYGGRVALNKQSGNFYLNAAFGVISPGFETSDLGYFFRSDLINSHIVAGYQWFQPDGFFRSKSFQVATYRSYDFDGDITGHGYFLFYNFQLMNFWGASGDFSYNPGVFDTRNTRGGPKFKNTNGYGSWINIWSDSRHSMTYSLYAEAGHSESGSFYYDGGPSFQWKATPSLRFTFSPYYTRNYTFAQYVDQVSDPAATATYGTRYLFAQLDQREISAGIRVDWVFSPRLSLQVYMQPLISVGRYSAFKELARPGEFAFTTLDSRTDAENDLVYIYPNGVNNPTDVIAESNPDFNYKFLLGNAILRWEYMPGSAIYLVWTHQQTNNDDPGNYAFGPNLGHLITERGDNVFQVKVSYWWNP